MNGIDVSKWNGNIDFKKVKASGVNFAILRAGYGMFDYQKDPKFETYYKQAKSAGLAVGAYFYSYAKNKTEAKKEAQIFLKWIKGKTFEFPVYLDIEDKSQENLSKKVLTDICIAWLSEVEKSGYYVGIYANPNWFENKLDLDRLKNYDKWLAHWVEKPKWGNEFGGLWQYTDKGAVKGIKGNVDLDKSYRDYPKLIKNAGLNGFKKPAKTTTSGFKPYIVKVVCKSLNIRKTPNWSNSDVVGVVKKNQAFTIVAEKNLDGTKFGKLKSGAGWISLGNKYVKRVK